MFRDMAYKPEQRNVGSFGGVSDEIKYKVNVDTDNYLFPNNRAHEGCILLHFFQKCYLS